MELPPTNQCAHSDTTWHTDSGDVTVTNNQFLILHPPSPLNPDCHYFWASPRTTYIACRIGQAYLSLYFGDTFFLLELNPGITAISFFRRRMNWFGIFETTPAVRSFTRTQSFSNELASGGSQDKKPCFERTS